MTQIKISSDPYRSLLSYQIWDEDAGAWTDYSRLNRPSSTLFNDKYAKSFFPFKAREILDILIHDFCGIIESESLGLIFEGTEDEYSELEQLCVEEPYKSRVQLSRSDTYLSNASEILPKIVEVFKNVADLVEKTNCEEKKKKKTRKFAEATNEKIPICVVGNYSSGKSTFINALIGTEILPSNAKPVTGRVFKISNSDDKNRAQISFDYDEQKYVVKITKHSFAINGGSEEKVVYQQITNVLDMTRDSSLQLRVNKVLEILNGIDYDKSDGTVEVSIPFGRGVLSESKHSYVIFDTPGSNSTSNEKHKEVLNESLKGFSNGIPIIVSRLETLDADDNDKLCELIESIKGFDKRFALIVVNKADLANVFIQEKQTAGDDTDAATRHKLEKETIFTKVLEHGNDDVDKDLSVYFWQEQEDLEKLLKDRLVTDMQTLTGRSAETERELHDLWTVATKDAPERFQVISPYRGEFYGTMSINTFMQSTFNGYWSRRLSVDGIGLYDKVIQIRNRPASDKAYVYDWNTRKPGRQEVYNGEIATVLPMAYEAKKISWMTNLQHFQCKFSGKTRANYSYNYGKFLGKDEKGYWIPDQNVADNLELAYAISVHKSQGSEFDYVYIVIPKRESHLLTMELLYTALTRAQRHVTVFLQQDISTLTTMSHVEKSAVRKINSSVFEFNPLPDELLYSGDWFKEEKKLATLSEYYVRSKSEVIIANMLVSEEVPFVYEEPLYAKDGTMYLPDFTVKFKGETYYWEHVGRLDLPGYKAHWEKKEKWYKKNFPGKLLITYEGKDLSIAAMEIIQNYK